LSGKLVDGEHGEDLERADCEDGGDYGTVFRAKGGAELDEIKLDGWDIECKDRDVLRKPYRERSPIEKQNRDANKIRCKLSPLLVQRGRNRAVDGTQEEL
jgi:hypothetical protein